MPAPSLAYLISTGASLAVSCPKCSTLRAVDLLALAVARGENATLAEIKFRCRVHGLPGQLIATGPGNALMGRKRVWPVE